MDSRACLIAITKIVPIIPLHQPSTFIVNFTELKEQIKNSGRHNNINIVSTGEELSFTK